ncbi:cardiac-enriched FHL2-interacting protein isoform X2 [Bufo gargarizans]|uniref:cardiac-enriched FHL2-interacting protein isoform X2 n=1 Tax=Bufo gargarizans TaxID=30331 RepID=UPI001CF101A2|nr:cardiac-enriched FHL2-interacting protein isoform X2 [Bufo gargarizans]
MVWSERAIPPFFSFRKEAVDKFILLVFSPPLRNAWIWRQDITQLIVTDPDSIEVTHSLQPGDWVVVKRHVRKVLEPRFEGPHQVLLTTATAVKLEGKPNWVHASHCKKVPEPQVLE